MIRILFWLALIFALGLGFAWLADRPGEMVVTFDGYRYTVSLMVAAVLVVATVAATMLGWWVVKGIWNSPHAISRYFRVRRRDRGYQALSTGMIAAGAGDAAEARRHKKQALKLISADTEPLLHLLDAQASLLEGDHDAARKKFEAMLDDPETRLLGLRGLYLEAERLGDRRAAYHYAERAAETAPHLSWASGATLEARTGQRDWDGALRLLDVQKSTRQVDRDSANRKRAVLLAAKAIDLLDQDPLAARNAAIEANRLAPDLVPAAVIAARAVFKQNDLRKGAKILETVWRQVAHPEVAEAYVHARPGDSTHDRLARARKLLSLRRNNAEAELVVARAALAAGEHADARRHAEAALRLDPREGAYLLMADIEEADGADQGRIRQWLSRAVRAAPDDAWVADGVVADRWAPVSPVTGRLDAFVWRAPVERLGQVIDEEKTFLPVPKAQHVEDAELVLTVEPAKPDEAIVETPVPEAVKPPVQVVQPQPETEHRQPAVAATIPTQPAASPVGATPPPAVAPVQNPSAVEAPAAAPTPSPVRTGPPALSVVPNVGPGVEAPVAEAPFVPDDPGVDAGKEAATAQPGRFRLF